MKYEYWYGASYDKHHIEGENLRDLIAAHAHKLASCVGLGSAAGTHLSHAHIERRAGSPDICVCFRCQGLPLAGQEAGAPREGKCYLTGYESNAPISDADLADLVWDFGDITPDDPENYYDFCHRKHPRYAAL